jgi:hypothetical protein
MQEAVFTCPKRDLAAMAYLPMEQQFNALLLQGAAWMQPK